MSLGSALFLLVAVGCGLACALVAAGTPGLWRLAPLWVGQSAISFAVFLSGSSVGLSLTADLVVVVVAGAALAYAVTRWSVVPRRRRSLGSALVATTLGALTPLIALYLLLALLFGGLGGGMTD